MLGYGSIAFNLSPHLTCEDYRESFHPGEDLSKAGLLARKPDAWADMWVLRGTPANQLEVYRALAHRTFSNGNVSLYRDLMHFVPSIGSMTDVTQTTYWLRVVQCLLIDEKSEIMHVR